MTHQRLSSQEPGNSITYSSVNSVLLLKTPGGSSLIWLLPQLQVLRVNANRMYLKAILFLLRGPMTIEARPNLQIERGKVVETFKIFFLKRGEKIFGGQQLDETRRRIKKFYNCCLQRPTH